MTWVEIPASRLYVMPTYRRSDGCVVRYDMQRMLWCSDDIDGTAVHPRAVQDAVDAAVPLELRQRIASITFNQHGALIVVSDVGRIYKFDAYSETWEPLQLPPLPNVR